MWDYRIFAVGQLTDTRDVTVLLHFRLNSGWSFKTSGPTKGKSKENITVSEQEIIKEVIQRSDKIRQKEEERVGVVLSSLYYAAVKYFCSSTLFSAFD